VIEGLEVLWEVETADWFLERHASHSLEKVCYQRRRS